MNDRNGSNVNTNWGIGTAIGAALGASACCTIPLALVSFGLGGAWIGSLTALAPYRWVFVGLALSALGYAGYNEWRLSHRPDCDCDTVFSSTTRRTLLGMCSLAVVLLIVSPWLFGGVSPATSHQISMTGIESTVGPSAAEPESTTPASFRQVVLEVEGMTCKTCPVTVRKALKDIEGVYSAKATFKPPQAVVRFDPETTSLEALTQATRDIGFPSRPKSNF
jgi:mercuric transport protein